MYPTKLSLATRDLHNILLSPNFSVSTLGAYDHFRTHSVHNDTLFLYGCIKSSIMDCGRVNSFGNFEVSFYSDEELRGSNGDSVPSYFVSNFCKSFRGISCFKKILQKISEQNNIGFYQGNSCHMFTTQRAFLCCLCTCN